MIDPITDYILQEQFNPGPMIARVKGQMNVEWTDCYEDRCSGVESHEAKVCKSNCILLSITNAITKMARVRTQCNKSKNPSSCIDRVNNSIDMLRKKLNKERERRGKALDQWAEYRRRPTGGA